MGKEWQVGGLEGVGARKGICATLRHLNFIPCTMGSIVDFFKQVSM